MCGRVIQSSGPLRYGIVEGMDMRDSRTHNYPPRWNAAPSQDLLVIRRNHETGTISLDPLRWGFIIPHWCKDPTGGRKPIRRVLDTLPSTGKFVLNSADRPFGDHSGPKEKVAPAIRPWTLHDLRRSFASGLQRLGVARG